MTPTNNDLFPSEREVRYVVKLHLDTARFVRRHERIADQTVYEVEGKIRPALIVREIARERGRRRFLVLCLTTKGLDEQNVTKPECIPVGKLIDSDVDSFVELRLQCMP